jgi:hypothetical protein
MDLESFSKKDKTILKIWFLELKKLLYTSDKKFINSDNFPQPAYVTS